MTPHRLPRRTRRAAAPGPRHAAGVRIRAAPITAALAVAAALGAGPPAAADERPLTGRVVARLSVTVSPDDSGTLLVPSPFAVLPDGERVAIYVPASGGIFLLRGEDILHHFPLPPRIEAIQDLVATDDLIVAGRRPTEGRDTCLLDVFHTDTGETPGTIRSANPHLRCTGEGADLWRVVVEDSLVGVYHPGTGSTVPLWREGHGILAGSEQMARQVAGIGLDARSAWVPRADGTVARKVRDRTHVVTGPDDGFFLDGLPNGDLLMLEPTGVADVPGEAGILLPPVLRVRLWHREEAITELSLNTVSGRIGAERLVVEGRPVRVLGDRIYWIFVGYDYLEIRSTDLPPEPAEPPPPPAPVFGP